MPFNLRQLLGINHRHPDSLTEPLLSKAVPLLSSEDKSRAALSLIRRETNPQRILDICRSPSLSPDSFLDRIAFSEAISKLKQLHHYSSIRSFIQEYLTRPDLQAEHYISSFIVLYGEAGLVDDAIRTFEDMDRMGIQRDVNTLNSLMFACIVSKDYAQVKRIFFEYPKRYGFIPNSDTYCLVIDGFCGSGCSGCVYSIFDEMSRRNVKPKPMTFVRCISGFYKEEKYDDVDKMLEMMKQQYNLAPENSVSLCNIRIKNLCELKKSTEAKALFDRILSRGLKVYDVMYRHLILGFCHEGNLEEAKSLFERMVSSGLRPDVECCSTLVYSLCEVKDFEGALKICKRCMGEGSVPNFTTMKLLVEWLTSIMKLDDAWEIIGQLKEKFPRNIDKWNEIEEGLPNSLKPSTE